MKFLLASFVLCTAVFAAEGAKPAPKADPGWGVPLFANAVPANDWLVCRQRCDTGKHGCIGMDRKTKESVAHCEQQHTQCLAQCNKDFKH